VTVLPVENLSTATKDADTIVLGVSSPGIPWATEQLEAHLRPGLPVISLTKGMVVVDGEGSAAGSGLEVIPQAVRRRLPPALAESCPIMAIGGPCIAGELAVGRHSSVVLTGLHGAPLSDVASLLQTEYYHVSTSTDVVGVELCAAFKNFYAIGVGVARGVLAASTNQTNHAGMHNPAAALFAQAIREMLVLCRYFGGEISSVWGLPGAGDLYVTVQSGRNARLGEWLGQGLSYREAREVRMRGETVEGADLAIAVGPTIERALADGRLTADRLPLAGALLDTILRNRPFVVPWGKMS
jgi:glycerol-3-phosphate dehydrogenase (NAD(P)+)